MKRDIIYAKGDTLDYYAKNHNGRLPVSHIKEEPKKGAYFDFKQMKMIEVKQWN